LNGTDGQVTAAENGIGRSLNDRRYLIGNLLISELKAARNNGDVLALDETVTAQFIEERKNGRRLPSGSGQETDAINAPWLLRSHRNRPRRRRTAQQRHELAAPKVLAHSITSSARADKVGEILRRLMCSPGSRSAPYHIVNRVVHHSKFDRWWRLR
jgi:hypothetical protein